MTVRDLLYRLSDTPFELELYSSDYKNNEGVVKTIVEFGNGKSISQILNEDLWNAIKNMIVNNIQMLDMPDSYKNAFPGCEEILSIFVDMDKTSKSNKDYIIKVFG